jgi:hypothetical protein
MTLSEVWGIAGELLNSGVKILALSRPTAAATVTFFNDRCGRAEPLRSVVETSMDFASVN